ncbi:hypothetical protein [Pseudomonas plecoglossicida]|uniref:hypothetical protein n=1 Tax=Pseudomonas plecoglossicida TaxID=70775 RepID=UPI00051D1179|nr:hypothetical protein [Pseudomonas plecoglossicida]KGK28577.1 hypothetical protein GT93_28185 [Pseudomonas plecoglossicida]
MESPLINLALLEALKTEKFSDEIDLFLPFIAVTISELGMPTVQVADIQTKLSELFGFHPPISAIRVLMTRAKNKNLLIKENHAYIPRAEKIQEWSNGYSKKKEDLEVSLGSLKKGFIEYTQERFQKELPLAEAESLIFQFIEENVSAAVSRRAYNKAELENSIKNTSHITASFIGHIHKKEPVLLEHFGRCVKGMLLANYLYFADKRTQKKTFERITVYLDSPLIIGLLGFNGPFNKQANEEFVELLTSLKIKVCIFDKTLDEIERLLSAWKTDIAKKSFRRFNTKTLELLRSQGYDEARLDTEIKTLHRTIENKGISIVLGFSAKERFQCDEDALEKAIAENFKKEKNLEHDTVCISRVHNTREGRHIRELSESFSVFVTRNTGLAKYANGFFSKNGYSSPIPVVVSEQWMTIMFWLKNPDMTGKLATDQVVATAYSLLYTDDKFWDAFLDRLDTIKRRGDISEEDFVLVRWDADLLRMVQDASVEVGDEFSEEDVFDIVDGIKRKYLADSEQAIADLQQQQAEEIHRLQVDAQAALATERDAKDTAQAEKETIVLRHQALETKIRKISRFLARCISTPICLTLVAFLIIASIQSLPAGVIPQVLQDAKLFENLKLSATTISITFLTTLAWGISSWVFGLDVKKVNKFIEDWLAEKILALFMGKPDM